MICRCVFFGGPPGQVPIQVAQPDGSVVIRYEPCTSCRGSGVAYCCEGEGRELAPSAGGRGEAMISEDVLRELRYCAAGPGLLFAGGQVGHAQRHALERGWLEPAPGSDPVFLRVTAAGQAAIKRLAAAADA